MARRCKSPLCFNFHEMVLLGQGVVWGFLHPLAIRREAIDACLPPCFHAHSRSSSLAWLGAWWGPSSSGAAIHPAAFSGLRGSRRPRPGESSQSPGLGGLTHIDRLVTDRLEFRVAALVLTPASSTVCTHVTIPSSRRASSSSRPPRRKTSSRRLRNFQGAPAR